jgi:hypothetical protein
MKICRSATILGLLFFLLFLSATASAEESIEIRVKKGENLYTVCQDFLENIEDWRQVARINGIKNPHRIYPGQKLIIPLRLTRGVPVDGIVTFITGEVSVISSGSQEWQTLRLNDRIAQGNRIQTGETGAVEITFENDFTVFLRSKTTIEVTATRKKGALYLLYRLFLRTGKVVSRLKQISGKESRLEIQTPSAVATPRGTAFRSAVDAEATTRIEVLNGEVLVWGTQRTVEINAGEGTRVEKDKDPVKPRKLLSPPSPLDLWSLYRAMPLEFRFEQVEGASLYRIMLARDKEFKVLIRNKVIKPYDRLQIGGIEDGTYFLQSRSIDDIGLEGISLKPVEVRVRVNPLPPFTQSPENGAEFREKSIRFQWLNASQAVRYHLQVAEDPGFNSIIENRPDIDGVSHKIGNLNYKTYYFRVCSIAADGYQGIWSDTLHFTIIPPPPSPPLEQPQMGDRELRIRWPGQGNGVSYHFQMSKDQAFKNMVVEKRLAEPQINLEKPRYPGTYYVRVRSIDAQGYAGSFSEPQSFDVTSKLLDVTMGIIGLIALLIIVL